MDQKSELCNEGGNPSSCSLKILKHMVIQGRGATPEVQLILKSLYKLLTIKYKKLEQYRSYTFLYRKPAGTNKSGFARTKMLSVEISPEPIQEESWQYRTSLRCNNMSIQTFFKRTGLTAGDSFILVDVDV